MDNVLTKKYKILVVDDEPMNLDIMVNSIEPIEYEHEILLAINGKRALEVIQNDFPDIIITDWEMPEMSGIELIHQLKSDDATRDIPIIICTGKKVSNNDLEQALSVGASDYVRKPIDPIELRARTSSALQLSIYQNLIVEQKNRELAENSMYLVQINQFNSQLIDELNSISKQMENNPCKISLLGVIDTIQTKIREDSWKRFDIYFERVYSGFQRKISKAFPTLTPAELRLCSFLRLGMNTKDIASVNISTVDSVKTQRSRLRKKLGLSKDENFMTFLARY